MDRTLETVPEGHLADAATAPAGSIEMGLYDSGTGAFRLSVEVYGDA